MSEPGLETVEGRLATFYAHHGVSKARPSGAKGAKASEWPHKSPSPEDLAHAGFYFQPTSLSPDNAACFLCERALDGWEEEDDPITEHLRHSSECGWAISVDIARCSSNPDEIEDPTSQRIVDARRATFGSLWPHDGKRGWVCKTEKMVDAGWYYCPIDGSDDFVSCAYCKLSLDGWEPKDDPFDEHYRRSSDCSFFLFASKKTTKSTRGRKARSSKASRLSTQSTMTTTSEAPTLDFDDEMDNTVLSQSTTKSTTKTSKKKGPKSKGRSTKSKKTDPVEVSSQADLESNDEIVEPPRPKRTTRGRKRTNSVMQGHEENVKADEPATEEEPPAKRRATGASDVTIQPEAESTMDHMEMVLPDEPETIVKKPPGRPKNQKRSSSKTRKPYTSSTASKASLRFGAPRDSEIDMQLEAELDAADVTATEELMEDAAGSNGPPQKSGSTASVAPVRAAKPELHDDALAEVEPDAAPPQKGKKSTQGKKKTTTTKKSSRVHADQNLEKPSDGSQAGRKGRPKGTKTSVLSTAQDVLEDHNMDDPDTIVAVPQEPQEEPADMVISEPPAAKKKGKGKAVASKPKKAKSSEHVDADPVDENAAPTVVSDHESPKPGHTDASSVDEKFSKEVGVEEPAEPPAKQPDSPEERDTPRMDEGNNGKRQLSDAMRTAPAKATQPSPHPTSPPASTQKFTPSLSPQSSDAENHPPSSLPSTARPVLSPTKSQAIKVPLAASTPTTSPSKRLRPGQLTTTHPWIPADLDEVFLANSPNKENINLNDVLHAVKGELTSPEKKLTVEEWIRLNAKKGEEKLRNECERLVGVFEREGGRAMRALEGIECTE